MQAFWKLKFIGISQKNLEDTFYFLSPKLQDRENFKAVCSLINSFHTIKWSNTYDKKSESFNANKNNYSYFLEDGLLNTLFKYIF